MRKDIPQVPPTSRTSSSSSSSLRSPLALTSWFRLVVVCICVIWQPPKARVCCPFFFNRCSIQQPKWWEYVPPHMLLPGPASSQTSILPLPFPSTLGWLVLCVCPWSTATYFFILGSNFLVPIFSEGCYVLLWDTCKIPAPQNSYVEAWATSLF